MGWIEKIKNEAILYRFWPCKMYRVYRKSKAIAKKHLENQVYRVIVPS